VASAQAAQTTIVSTMATIDVTASFPFLPTEALYKLKQLGKELDDAGDMKVIWTSDRSALLQSKRASGHLQITDGQVHIWVELSLLASAFKGQISKRIKTELKKYDFAVV
jgi:hypothetical protein